MSAAGSFGQDCITCAVSAAGTFGQDCITCAVSAAGTFGQDCIKCAVSAAGTFVLPVFIYPRQKMVTLPEVEDDDLETATDKCFACDDLGKQENYESDAEVVNLGAEGVQLVGLP